MVNYKEILRLSAEGNSQRQIAAGSGNSRNTVIEVLEAASADCGKSEWNHVST